MHDIFFSIKRAFHRTTAFSARFLAPFGLTPARFDLLHAVGPFGVPQVGLRQLLGVTAPTISRMVIALERRGWLVRGLVPGRRRALFIKLTQFGRMMFRAAAKRGVRSPLVPNALKNAFARHPPDPKRSIVTVDATLTAFRHDLAAIRVGFGDLLTRLSWSVFQPLLKGRALLLQRITINPAYRTPYLRMKKAPAPSRNRGFLGLVARET